MTARILLAGGGTGGHVVPALATAEALRRARPDVDVEFVGTARGLESRMVPAAGWTLHPVEILPLLRRLTAANLRVPAALLRATAQVARLIGERDVVAAATFGGYVSLPLALAARRTRTPLVVHEQNAVPGLANRLAARRAAAVAVTFPGSEARVGGRAVLTGNPVRPGLADGDRPALRAEALGAFGLEAGRATLLVFGGSQGARRINEAVVAAAGRWQRPEALQVLHVTGRRELEAVTAAWAAAGAAPLHVRCVDFVDRMDLAYAAADVAVCRAGASSIAELTVLGLPAVLVPYPHATADHQTANARAVADAGGAICIADGDLDAAALVAAAEPLLLDPERRGEMGVAARAVGRPDAADRVAALVLQAAGLTGQGGGGASGFEDPDGPVRNTGPR